MTESINIIVHAVRENPVLILVAIGGVTLAAVAIRLIRNAVERRLVDRKVAQWAREDERNRHYDNLRGTYSPRGKDFR